MIKTFNKPGIDKLLKSDQDIYKRYTASITINDERLNAFSVRSGRKLGCPLT